MNCKICGDRPNLHSRLCVLGKNTKLKKWIVGYQEIIDCSVIVHAATPEEALALAKNHCDEAEKTYSQGEVDKELWTDPCIDLIEED